MLYFFFLFVDGFEHFHYDISWHHFLHVSFSFYVFAVPRLEPRALSLLGMLSTTKLYP
jgi:hypothetical protein